MRFSYNRLWKLLIDKNLMKKDLMALTNITSSTMAKSNITSSTMAKLGKDLPVSMGVLGRICEALDCNIGDIVDYIKD